MDVTSEIRKLLDKKKFQYKFMEHEPTPTSEIAAKVRGVDLKQGAKAMLLRSEGKFYMFVLSGVDKIDFKKIKRLLKSKSVSFANPEEVLKVTNCEVGGVPPFGNLFNVPVYIDKNLLDNKKIDFNAGKQTVSIEMNLNDYIKVVKPKVEEFTR